MRDVHMGSLEIGRAPEVLTASGIGSCIAVILYDPGKKLGGLAHIMRPKYEGQKTEHLFKFADHVIPEMLKRILAEGANRDSIHAKIVGGANMFGDVFGDGLDIGHENTEAAKEILNKLGVHITDEDTGGHIGKTVYFDLSTGLLDVRFKM